jgi:hypothetical protein
VPREIRCLPSTIYTHPTANIVPGISSTIFGSAAIFQTLGIKYELQWTLRHYDLVIGECPLAGFKVVKVKPLAGSLSGL